MTQLSIDIPPSGLTTGVHGTRAAQRAGWGPVERAVRHDIHIFLFALALTTILDETALPLLRPH